MDDFINNINWDYVFTFGKHCGESINDVVIDDPSYILWLSDNTEHIILKEILETAEENAFFDNI